MKVVVVHGQAHKGNTYHLTHMLLDKLGCEKEELEEFTVNGIGQCVGCYKCILEDENLCPHRAQGAPVIEAIEEADVVIIDSPNYCMSMSGQLKTFFDHMGYRWMSHRPHGGMNGKIGVAVSTTSGFGASGVTKDICKQFFWWGIGKTYRIPFTAAATSWDEVEEKKKVKIAKKVKRVAAKIKRKAGKVKPSLKTKIIFSVMKKMQEGMAYNPVDVEYWKSQGWIK